MKPIYPIMASRFRNYAMTFDAISECKSVPTNHDQHPIAAFTERHSSLTMLTSRNFFQHFTPLFQSHHVA